MSQSQKLSQEASAARRAANKATSETVATKLRAKAIRLEKLALLARLGEVKTR